LNYTQNTFHISDESGSDQRIIEHFLYQPNDYLVLKTATPCEEGKFYNFTATGFQGILGDDIYGLYKSEYLTESGDPRYEVFHS